jgi:hypothetical protein
MPFTASHPATQPASQPASQPETNSATKSKIFATKSGGQEDQTHDQQCDQETRPRSKSPLVRARPRANIRDGQTHDQERDKSHNQVRNAQDQACGQDLNIRDRPLAKRTPGRSRCGGLGLVRSPRHDDVVVAICAQMFSLRRGVADCVNARRRRRRMRDFDGGALFSFECYVCVILLASLGGA